MGTTMSTPAAAGSWPPCMRIEPEPDSAQGDLIVRLKRGDCQAYRELLDEYGEQLYGTALRITISATDAEDAVQETLLSTFQHIGTFESRSSLRTWLTRVCINAALTRIRRNSRHKIQSLDDTSFDGSPESSRELPDHRENPEQALRGSELQGLLDRYLRALSPGLRQVFVLRDVEEMSGEETALLLGITVAAVKTRLARARQALRRNLGPHLTTIRSTMALQPAR